MKIIESLLEVDVEKTKEEITQVKDSIQLRSMISLKCVKQTSN